MNWLKRLLNRVIDLMVTVFDETLEVTQYIPGVPFILKKRLLNEFVEMSGHLKVDAQKALIITAQLDLVIRPGDTLRNVREKLMPLHLRLQEDPVT